MTQEATYQAVPEVASDERAPHAGTVVMKLGGTSVSGPERLKGVARRLVEAREAGNRVDALDAVRIVLVAGFHALSYEEMLEMAASGAPVLQLRSVEFARNHNVRRHVRSTFADADGTWITGEEDPMLEKAIISGVVHTREELVYRVTGIGAADLFDALARASVNVDTIVQASAGEILFSAPGEDRVDAERTLARLGADWSLRDDLGKVSVVGAGMKSHPGVAAKTSATLREQGVEPAVVTTSAIKIACHVPTGDVERAVRALHEAFDLG